MQKIFDFLLEGELVRGTLEQTLLEKGISTERSIELEYILAIPPPKETGAHKEDDWISDILAFRTGDATFGISALYNGIVTISKISGCNDVRIQSHIKVSEGQANALSLCSQIDGVPRGFLVGTNDHDVKLFRMQIDEEVSNSSPLLFVGHNDSVECLSVSPDESRFVSGGWDNTICLWELDVPDAFFSSHSGRKRRKTRDKEPQFENSEPLLKLVGHKQCISALEWIQSSALFSGSWDHTVNCWDVASAKVTTSYHSSHPVYSISAQPETETPCIALGGGDNIIRLWDTRERQGEQAASVKMLAPSHEGWITCVRWCPDSHYHFASSSTDGAVKLWDVRSAVPLATLTRHGGKAFTVAWLDASFVLSGGEDAMLRLAAADMQLGVELAHK